MTFNKLTILIECTLFLLLCSCNGQKGAHSIEEQTPDCVTIPDTSIYGQLKEITADSLIFELRYTGERVAYAYDQARDEGQILGNVKEGDQYGLSVDRNKNMAQYIVNLTNLAGQWFFDKEGQRGFHFSTRGALSSINPDDVCFEKWELVNRHIVISYVNKDDKVHTKKEYLTDTTDIEILTPDELVFTFRGQRMNCQRQKEAIKIKLQF